MFRLFKAVSQPHSSGTTDLHVSDVSCRTVVPKVGVKVED